MLEVESACVALALGLSLLLAAQHGRSFLVYNQQRRLLRLVLITPACALLQLFFPRSSAAALLATALQAFAAFQFHRLLLAYLDDGDAEEEEAAAGNEGGLFEAAFSVLAWLEARPPPTLPSPFRRCCPCPLPNGRRFFVLVRRSVLQSCLLLPLCALLSALLPSNVVSCVLLVVASTSAALCLLGLCTFLRALRPRLTAHSPALKLAALAALAFLPLWERTLLAFAEPPSPAPAPVSTDADDWTSGSSGSGSEDLLTALVCAQALLLSLAHWWLYPPSQYQYQLPPAWAAADSSHGPSNNNTNSNTNTTNSSNTSTNSSSSGEYVSLAQWAALPAAVLPSKAQAWTGAGAGAGAGAWAGGSRGSRAAAGSGLRAALLSGQGEGEGEGQGEGSSVEEVAFSFSPPAPTAGSAFASASASASASAFASASGSGSGPGSGPGSGGGAGLYRAVASAEGGEGGLAGWGSAPPPPPAAAVREGPGLNL